MSVQAMTWAMDQQIVTEPHARHVLLCLANYADKFGRAAFPSISTLSLDTGLAPRTIQYRLRDLEGAGLIAKGNQAVAAAYIDRKDRVPVCYEVILERGAQHARGARQDETGCTPEQNGVHAKTERGAQHAPNPSLNHQGTTIEPTTVTEVTGADQSVEQFSQFWSRYPKKVQRKDALKAWTKLKPNADLFARIMTALGNQMASHDWLKENGRYIPNGATWLNGERWLDEVVKGAAGARRSGLGDLPQHTADQYGEGNQW
ncbi:helix-turn-helix domain-containing protein [Pseudomonas oryzihabitans]|uniref:helix-turn-helix domain-containing protein n=1 Tax=Pseudomonas oryzihabitans TaxID=47885 RepID=UPI00119FB75A|nr:helix-turn-helix domain-containing protein [Pseudomonas psychrotolerans]